MTDTRPIAIQDLLWPEFGVSTEQHLYFRLLRAAGFSSSRQRIELSTGGSVHFDTATNLFNFRKWHRLCGLDSLGLQLRGAGRFAITVYQVSPTQTWERLYEDVQIIPDNGVLDLDLTERLLAPEHSVLFFTLEAMGEGHLDGASWTTMMEPRRRPRLALSITTFKREEAVADSVRRFEDFVAQSPLRDDLHLIVVDNGNSADLVPSTHFTPVVNRNLGGSGGFARGLHEAHAQGFTHCLFMDDDAKVHMRALERVWWFLAYAKDLSVAVSGGLTQADARWRVWENGAHFDKHCFPHWLGTDLRDFASVLRMEHENSRRQRKNYYGGWWFFAFAIGGIKHWPFPFFVRGDDISFSIANELTITTLPGAICFQDADFSAKESLQTLYLDMRSHMIHHIVLPPLDRGRREVLWVMAWFFRRSLVQCHYETLEALNIAAEDVLAGPGFFATNADMAARRATLGALRRDEAWKPHDPDEVIPERLRLHPHHSRFWFWLLHKTLNGHLLPFFGLFGNRIVQPAGARGDLHPVWGAAQITYLAEEGEQAFTVRHSKAKAYRQGFRMLRNLIRTAIRYPALRHQWQTGYDDMTTETFWVDTFKDPQNEAAASGKVESAA